MSTLLEIFPHPKELLALAPQDLASVLLDIIPQIERNGGFQLIEFVSQLYPPFANANDVIYPRSSKSEVQLAIAEALEWLKTQGIVISNPDQSPAFMILTRAGRKMKSKVDLEAFKKGRELPQSLLHPTVVEKSYSPFLRGDYADAVFSAFKAVEIAVRNAANYGKTRIGVEMMRSAFKIDGTLASRDPNRNPSEQDAEMNLFVGAIGAARNPTGHHDVIVDCATAARWLVFASQLLSIVDERTHDIAQAKDG